MTRFLLTCLLLCLSTTAMAGELIMFLFPMLKPQQQRVDNTYEAPFLSEEAIKMAEEASKESKSDITKLAQPHRPDTEIAAWLKTQLPLILSMEDNISDTHKDQFSERGWQEFEQFLQSSDIQSYINNPQYVVKTVVADDPLLLEKAPVGNYYFWMYQIPVLVTYLNKRMTDYNAGAPPQTASFTLTIQIRRTVQANNEHNILIERFGGE